MGGAAIDYSTDLEIESASGFFGRMRGLIGRGELAPRQAFLIEHCSSVHGFGIFVPLDVAFIARDGTILKIVQLKPNRIASCRAAQHVLEMRFGECDRLGISVGEKI